MQSLMVNNMYAAYSATSSYVDSKSVSDLSKMMKGEKKAKETADEPLHAKSMDTVIISKEALQLLKESRNKQS